MIIIDISSQQQTEREKKQESSMQEYFELIQGIMN
jgi:hypothetical protein